MQFTTRFSGLNPVRNLAVSKSWSIGWTVDEARVAAQRRGTQALPSCSSACRPINAPTTAIRPLEK